MTELDLGVRFAFEREGSVLCYGRRLEPLSDVEFVLIIGLAVLQTEGEGVVCKRVISCGRFEAKFFPNAVEVKFDVIVVGGSRCGPLSSDGSDR